MPPRERPIVVTGAGGFIGRHLTESLVQSGVRVKGITRSARSLGEGVEVSLASDILDRDAIRRAVENAGSVVHLAARVHAKKVRGDDPTSECKRINVDGTAILLEEAVAAGIETLVFISSVKAVARESDVALTPETPPQPQDPYGESKLEAERLVRVAAIRDGLKAPVLRLPVVYGPGMKANMASLFNAVSRGLPLPLGGVNNRRSFAYVGNVVTAIRALLDKPGIGSDIHYVSDGEDLSTPELVRRIARALGRPPRLFPVPSGLLGALSTGGLLSRIAGQHFSTDSVTAVIGSLFVDTSSLREMTGFTPPFSIEKGMATTANWFRDRHTGMSR